MSALGTYRILELSEGVSGEYCGKLLSDFGATLIKIERPAGGSPTRHMGPFGKGDVPGETSGLFAYLNTNKQSVSLDLTSDAGQRTLAGLIDHVDVVIDDHPSGWLAEVGLDPATFEERWPGVVLCSITAFGQNPPDDRLHAEDLTIFHASGWGYHTPGAGHDELPPLKGPGRFLVSYEAGLDAAMCISAALYEREESRRGQFIDISKHEVMVSRCDYVVALLIANDLDVGDGRGIYDLGGPGGIFPCQDGYIYIFTSTRQHWKALCELMGNPDWALSFPPLWLEKVEELTPERIAQARKGLVDWLATRGKDQAAAEAQALGITLVPINNTPETLRHPQFDHRLYYAEVEHPVLGKALYPTVPYKMTETPARITAPAPLLGQHSAAILAEEVGA